MNLTYPNGVGIRSSDGCYSLDYGSTDESMAPRGGKGSSIAVGRADETGGSGGASQEGSEYDLEKIHCFFKCVLWHFSN